MKERKPDGREVKHEATGAYMHWSNGVAERVILRMTRLAFTLLAARQLPSFLWQHALSFAYRMANCAPHVSIGMQQPYELFYGERPRVTNVQPFGCDVVITEPLDSPKKKKFLVPNSQRSVSRD